MDNDEKDQIPQNEEEQKSPSDNAGNISSKVEKVGKKTVGAIRGVGAGTEAAEATEAGIAGAEGLAAGETAAGAVTTAEGVAAGEVAAGAGIEAAATGAIAVEGAVAGVTTPLVTTGSSLGMWALGATLLTVFLITLVAVLFNGGGTPVNAGAGTPTISITPPAGQAPPCDPLDPATSLLQGYSITVATADKLRLKAICDIFAMPSQSSFYLNLLKSAGPINITFDSLPCGATAGLRFITLHSWTSCSILTQRQILIHETGHVINSGATGNGRIRQAFYSQAYYSPSNPNDPNCYYKSSVKIQSNPYYLLSYPAGIKDGGGEPESYAETLSQYVIHRSPLANYPTQCPGGFSWARDYIFGGYVF